MYMSHALWLEGGGGGGGEEEREIKCSFYHQVSTGRAMVRNSPMPIVHSETNVTCFSQSDHQI